MSFVDHLEALPHFLQQPQKQHWIEILRRTYSRKIMTGTIVKTTPIKTSGRQNKRKRNVTPNSSSKQRYANTPIIREMIKMSRIGEKIIYSKMIVIQAQALSEMFSSTQEPKREYCF